MKLVEEIRPGANRYINGQGAVDDLDRVMADYQQAIVVTGEKSYAAFQQNYHGEVTCPVFRYDGSASDEDGHAIAKQAPVQTDVVIGIGGGRVLDTAKVTAETLKADLISVPTLASNCAPFTPVGAIYHPVGHTFKYVEYFKKAPTVTIVDYNIMLTTPHDFFVAGIGDTLAKWYEMEGITRGHINDLPVFTRLSYQTAKVIKNTLVDSAQTALADLEEGRVSPAFTDVVDCIIGIASEVGGFGVSDGRMAGAHAVHNGLSYIEETHEILHGSKVAYGILVQLAQTGDQAEIETLLPFYRGIGLPTNLAELHIITDVATKSQQVAQWAARADETFNLIKSDVVAADVLADMQKVEDISVGNKQQ